MEKEDLSVLQVNKLYYPWIGGVEKVVQNIAEGLYKRLDMEVLACQPKGLGNKEEINGVKVTKSSSLGRFLGLPASPTFPLNYARLSRRADVLHFHVPFPLGVVSYLALGPRDKKVVVTYHSDIVRQEKLLRFYRPFLMKFLDAVDVILPTSPHLRDGSEFLAPFRDKCQVVPLSVDLEEFDRDALDPDDPGSPGTGDEDIVLFVGRLNYYKGVDYLIRAMEDVDARLLVAGEGPLLEQLNRQAITSGVTDRVEFLGRVSDRRLKELYAGCDTLVLPSVRESEAFGIVQMEAMAYGKPVINTDLPTGVPWVSKDGETGLTVPPADSDALASAINELLEDEERRREYGENAYHRVKEKFSRNGMLDTVESVYRDLV